ncbi:ABC transporter ATP-binding protein [Planctomycetota bacterium]|jgi:ABC-type lipoprotein export system ATPase subunit|nr:ABC transporter ATP-binding protein [Planctomycetota bacterium]MSR37810.1 ABC transporter ATP-binding protein [Planctomycetota bacterium]GDY03274.1 ABC transporter ATP-binding protein [Planctomycetota bacterium]
MIRLREVQKSYRQGERTTVACEVTSLDIAAGEHVALIGRSGTGKTTLLHMLAGILRPDQGTLSILGQDLSTLSESDCDRFRGQHIGMVYQTFNLLQPFTALENVLLGALFGRGAGADAEERALHLLAQVGLEDRMHHLPSQLSVGQVQRVAVCRALINNPELVLMDEPLGNQDKATGGQVLDLLLQLARNNKQTVVMVTHDPESATRMQRTVDLATLRRVSS